MTLNTIFVENELPVVMLSKEDKQLLAQVKIAYANMQKSWWEFAKILHEIREKRIYIQAGFRSFRKYILSEFPTIYESTAAKQITIVSNWREEIEEKLREGIPLPAYESCYRVITAKDRCTDEKYNQIKEDVLNNKISAGAVLREIKSVTDERKEKIRRIMNGPKGNDNILKDLDAEPGEYIYSVDEISVRVGELKKALTNFLDNIDSYEMTKKVYGLAKSLDELYLTIDEVLSELEDK